MKEVVSGELTEEQLYEELPFVVDELKQAGTSTVVVRHWAGQNEVMVDDLAEAMRNGFAHPHHPQLRMKIGESDFYLDSADGQTQFEFCHEDELHVRTSDRSLVKRFRSRWTEHGYDVRNQYALGGKNRDGSDERE